MQPKQTRNGQIISPTCFSLSSRSKVTCSSWCHLPACSFRGHPALPGLGQCCCRGSHWEVTGSFPQTPIRYRRTHMYILTDATDRLSIMFGDFFQICWVDRNIFKKHTTMMPPWSPVSRSFALYSLVSGSAGNLTTDNVQPE